MKLKQIIEPSPKCPRCKVHTISRISLMNERVYDCPKCQAVYRELKQELNKLKEKKE